MQVTKRQKKSLPEVIYCQNDINVQAETPPKSLGMAKLPNAKDTAQPWCSELEQQRLVLANSVCPSVQPWHLHLPLVQAHRCL